MTLSLVLCACLLATGGCSTEPSPREGLADLTSQQDELARIDKQAADFEFGAANSLGNAQKISDEYTDLLGKARESRPSEATGDEAVVWETFIKLLDLRRQGADALVAGVKSGDLGPMRTRIDALNVRTRELNRRFNEALSHIRGDKPPGQ